MRHIKEFEGLRGLMAFWVVVGHWSTTVAIDIWVFREKLFNQHAVTVFIVLSGFAIAAMLDKRQEPWAIYIQRRFLRIFPVYFLFLGLSVLAAPAAYEIWQSAPGGVMQESRVKIAADTLAYWPEHLVAHLTALHGIIPPKLLPSTDYAFLGQAWSISTEWQFYLIATAMVPFLLTRWTRPKFAIALGVGVFCMLANRVMPGGFIGQTLYAFVIGIYSFRFLKDRLNGEAWAQAIPIGQTWLVLVTVLMIALRIDSLPYVIWFTVIAAICAKDSLSAAWLVATLNAAPMQWLGRMAYSVYLSHMLVILVGLRIIEVYHISSPYYQAAFLLPFTVVCTILVSQLSYVCVELPFHNMGRRLTSGLFARAGARQETQTP